MSHIHIVLSKQDLGDFLEDNENWMEQYRAELQRRLAGHYGQATVEISRNALMDRITIDGESQEADTFGYDYIAGNMVNDWSWLKQ